MTSTHAKLRPARRQVLILLLAAIALYVIVPQFGSFRYSLSTLEDAQWSYLVPAILFTAASYVAAAGTYCLLAWHRLAYGRTLLVQVAGMFVNRLLPAGIGGIGVNYLYLLKSGHNGTRAASVVAVNNILGVLGNALLLILLLTLLHRDLPSLELSRITDPKLIIVIVAAAGLAWLVFYKWFGKRLTRSLRDFAHQLLEYRRRPARLLAALTCSVGLTLANVLAFWCCASALHIDLPFVTILLVFSFGILLGTATPTPGGLGGVEAGLVAGLVVYDVNSATALAAVLMYRLVSYWLPLAVGAGAFIYTQRRQYF